MPLELDTNNNDNNKKNWVYVYIVQKKIKNLEIRKKKEGLNPFVVILTRSMRNKNYDKIN
jgi:hypothetical protein